MLIFAESHFTKWVRILNLSLCNLINHEFLES